MGRPELPAPAMKVREPPCPVSLIEDLPLGTWGALSRCELPTPFVPGTTGSYTGTPCIDGLGDTEEA